jgi:hypothetical protein
MRFIQGIITVILRCATDFQQHRVLWLREMSEEEIRQVGESGPTIDSIEVAEFESHEELKEWLGKKAPAFLR